jgi:MtN3 and saliva related transmembrane protein
MADKIVIEITGSIAAVCSMTSFVPQLVKIWRERDATSVSLRMYAVSVIGFSLWTTYGFLIGKWPVIGCNTACLVMCLVILALKWRFGTTAGQTSGATSRA